MYHILRAQGQTQFLRGEEADQARRARDSMRGGEELATAVRRPIGGFDEERRLAGEDRRQHLFEPRGKRSGFARKPQGRQKPSPQQPLHLIGEIGARASAASWRRGRTAPFSPRRPRKRDRPPPTGRGRGACGRCRGSPTYPVRRRNGSAALRPSLRPRRCRDAPGPPGRGWRASSSRHAIPPVRRTPPELPLQGRTRQARPRPRALRPRVPARSSRRPRGRA